MLPNRSRYYLLITFLLGAIFGYLNSNESNPGFLFGAGLGFLIISFLIAITIPGIFLFFNFYKKGGKDDSILDENLEESEMESLKRKKEIREKPYLITFYISLLLFVLMLLG
ncbi:MAG: hypothetical protein R2769_08225 [Saprospiraceae bacterium]